MGVNNEHFKITIFLKNTSHFTNFISCYSSLWKGIYFVAFEDIASPLLCRQIERIEFTICQSGNLISKKECQQNLFLVQKIYWTQSTFTANGTLQKYWVWRKLLRAKYSNSELLLKTYWLFLQLYKMKDFAENYSNPDLLAQTYSNYSVYCRNIGQLVTRMQYRRNSSSNRFVDMKARQNVMH